jgi:hypothetical protein
VGRRSREEHRHTVERLGGRREQRTEEVIGLERAGEAFVEAPWRGGPLQLPTLSHGASVR